MQVFVGLTHNNRVGGSDHDLELGVQMADSTSFRTFGLTLLCSVLSFCQNKLVAHIQAGEEAPATTKRIDLLAPSALLA